MPKIHFETINNYNNCMFSVFNCIYKKKSIAGYLIHKSFYKVFLHRVQSINKQKNLIKKIAFNKNKQKKKIYYTHTHT